MAKCMVCESREADLSVTSDLSGLTAKGERFIEQTAKVVPDMKVCIECFVNGAKVAMDWKLTEEP